MTLPAGRSVSICTKSTGHLEEAVLQVLVTLDVFWAERVNLQEKYDDPQRLECGPEQSEAVLAVVLGRAVGDPLEARRHGFVRHRTGHGESQRLQERPGGRVGPKIEKVDRTGGLQAKQLSRSSDVQRQRGGFTADQVITNTATTHVVLPTGIASYQSAENIQLFPNPAQSELNIQLTTAVEKIQVIDVLGKILFEKKTNNQQNLKINISQFQNGVYFVKAYSTQGVVVKKFVKR